ncbi:hypothetical protein Droror1_Dr00013766 [Drosera rotundifolia]
MHMARLPVPPFPTSPLESSGSNLLSPSASPRQPSRGPRHQSPPASPTTTSLPPHLSSTTIGLVDSRSTLPSCEVESNGTVLSTNWKEVGAKKVKGSPPDGNTGEAEFARVAVRETMELLEGLLGRLEEKERNVVVRSMGLKIEQLKAELEQLNE